jgi:hypothetical protein
MANWTERDLIDAIVVKLPAEQRQPAFHNLRAIWTALKSYVESELTQGRGVVIQDVGALVFDSTTTSRDLLFAFFQPYLTRFALSVPPAEKKSVITDTRGMFDRFQPLRRLNFHQIASQAGVSPKDAKDGITLIFELVAERATKRVDGKIDLGCVVISFAGASVKSQLRAGALLASTSHKNLARTATFHSMV